MKLPKKTKPNTLGWSCLTTLLDWVYVEDFKQAISDDNQEVDWNINEPFEVLPILFEYYWNAWLKQSM